MQTMIQMPAIYIEESTRRKRKMKTAKLTLWNEQVEIGFSRETYANNGNLCIEAWLVENGCFTEPYSRVTVNLTKKCKENHAFIDSNNCPQEIIRWLEENNYVICTYNMEISGYCQYLEYVFSDEFLRSVVA